MVCFDNEKNILKGLLDEVNVFQQHRTFKFYKKMKFTQDIQILKEMDMFFQMDADGQNLLLLKKLQINSNICK